MDSPLDHVIRDGVLTRPRVGVRELVRVRELGGVNVVGKAEVRWGVLLVVEVEWG